MLKEVLIVLNDSIKENKELAKNIASLLKEADICADILSPNNNTLKKQVKSSKVVVLDYVLGNFGTAIDLLRSINSEESSINKPHILLFTKETNQNYAITAFREGASDFIRSDNKNALPMLINKIKKLLNTDVNKRNKNNYRLQKEELIATSKAMKTAVAQVKSALTSASLIVIKGDKGSGKKFIAQNIFNLHFQDKLLIEINLSFNLYPIDLLFFKLYPGVKGLKFREDYSVIFSGEEKDLIDFVATIKELPLLGNQQKNLLPIFISTNSKEVATLYKNILSANIVNLPNIKEREEDLLRLISSFIKASNAQNIKKIDISSLISKIKELNWPGNIKELKAILLESLLIDEECSTEKLISLLLQQKRVWEENYFQESTREISPLLALKALKKSGYNWGIAAAMLGCSSKNLRTIISEK